jgi:lipopolysaccharide export LptBFGC system permease protein LptF
MRTLDWYIVRSFLLSALLWLVSLLALRIMVDLFANMDEFAERGGFSEIVSGIVTYYGCHSVEYIAQLGGVIIVQSAVFTLARMNHTNELTAMLASGMSLYRVVWPIVLTAMLSGGLIIANQELLLPRMADQMLINADGTTEGRAEAFGVGLIPDGDKVWYAPQFDAQTNRMVSPLIQFRGRGHVAQATAYSKAWAVHIEATETTPAGWAMADGRLIRTGDSTAKIPSSDEIYTTVGKAVLIDSIRKELLAVGKAWTGPFRDAQGFSPVYDKKQQMEIAADGAEMIHHKGQLVFRLIYPRFSFYAADGDEKTLLVSFEAKHADWIAEGSEEMWHWELADEAAMFCPSELKPDDLVMHQIGHKTEYMSSVQLAKLLKAGRARNEKEVRLIRHVRIAEPINNLVMLLLGLPFILSRERNIKASFGLCVLTTGAFFAFVYVCRYMGLPPFWGAFLPTLLFGPIAIVMFDSVKT